jgi:hypothetical protein
VAVVQVRYPDRATEGATLRPHGYPQLDDGNRDCSNCRAAQGRSFLEKAVVVTRLDCPGCRVDDGVFMKVLVGVERLIPYQEVKIAMILVGARDCIHGDDSARGCGHTLPAHW